MTVYVDTSVVVRVLLREPNPVQIWGQWNKAYSSALWRVEALDWNAGPRSGSGL
jgi:hypothetical protein